MKLIYTATVLLLSLCSISAAAVLPNSSPAIAKPTSPAVRPYSPTHGTCFILLGIVEKKPHSVNDRESTAWVSLWDGAIKEFKGLTWGDGEPVRGIVTAHSIDGDPSSEALRIHGLFSPTDCLSIKWINPNPGSHQEWTVFNYSGGMVGDEEFDDTDNHWDVATCNRTAWTDTEWDQYSTDRITRCWFKC
ncbi:hypothetical protein ACET3X_009013 [Alternaria dauci]|uniref:Uncharacterized protein n=1 Tax=Alternaria dauci TaxID=48095 RepID=A0ABR3U7N1_9PLEO